MDGVFLSVLQYLLLNAVCCSLVNKSVAPGQKDWDAEMSVWTRIKNFAKDISVSDPEFLLKVSVLRLRWSRYLKAKGVLMLIQSNHCWWTLVKRLRPCLTPHSGGRLHSPAAEHPHHCQLLTGPGRQSALLQAARPQILLRRCAAALRLAGSCQDLHYGQYPLPLRSISFITSVLFLTSRICLQCFSSSLPMCLKKAMADKFKEFSEYQLAKYNTRKHRCKHNRNRSKPKVCKYWCSSLALFCHGCSSWRLRRPHTN